MGNQQNSSNPEGRKDKKEVVIETKNPNTKSFLAMTSKETNSSYKGVKTSGVNSSNELEKDVKAELTTECQTIPDNLDYKDVKIPTLFEWKEGGNIVYITGTFSNWSQWFMMTKTNNKFELNLELPRGVHQYKFIVDNVWCFSKHHPTCNDGKGNINNIIDTSNIDITEFLRKKNEKLKDGKTDYSNIFPKTNGQRIKKSGSNYNNTFPCKADLNVDAVVIPDNYKECYNINTYHKQFLIGNNEFLLKREIKNYIGGNSSFISVPVAPHVNLNHLSTKDGLSLVLKNQILVSSTVQRIRNKYVTLIYYKPLN